MPPPMQTSRTSNAKNIVGKLGTSVSDTLVDPPEELTEVLPVYLPSELLKYNVWSAKAEFVEVILPEESVVPNTFVSCPFEAP